MNNRIILFVFIVILFIHQGYAQDKTINQYLPSEEVLNDFQLTGDPEIYKGDDLYNLLNGGADVFFEYGFVQAIVADYKNTSGQKLQVEIYEMVDSHASYGIYSLQDIVDNKPDNLGDEGQIVKSNAFFIKGKYVVRLSGTFPEGEEEFILKQISENISSKIKVTGGKPLIIQLLPVQNAAFPEIIFFRGNIAFRNVYYFHLENIFKFDDGVAGIYPGYTIIILHYPGKLKSVQQFGIAKSTLSNDNRFSSFYSKKGLFQMVDNRTGKKISCHNYENYIIIFIYKGLKNINPLLKEIIFNIELIK
jgi:hypothetical protein